ncbi:MerR family transcriptional regulator [Kineosporia succinea]
MKTGWSTRELAKLAGITVKTVRHYHRVGLLAEPERAENGYKLYRVAHLIRLLRIRRLVDLGVSLADIAAIDESPERADQVFRALDQELAASIARQQRIRDELVEIKRHRTLADLPPGFDSVATGLSVADRAFLLIASRIFEPSVMDAYRELHRTPRSAAESDFDVLPEDADEDTRQNLAERYALEVIRQHREHPTLHELAERARSGADPQVWAVVVQGIAELHNDAQRDVLHRMNAIVYPGPGDG